MRLLTLLFIAPVAWAQVSIRPSFDSTKPISINITPAGRPFNAITGVPYSGDRVSERILSDNTHMSRAVVREFRDSSGRVREEHSGTGFGSLTLVEILDPIAGLDWVLDPEGQVAYRLPLQSKTHEGSKNLLPCDPGGEPKPRTMPDGNVATNQALGSKTIQGIEACGSKMVIHDKNGNPTTTTETWLSRENIGGILLDTISNNLQNGYNIRQLENISFSEPDPNLFLPPANYRVVDQKGSFNITGNAPPAHTATGPPPVQHSVVALTGMPWSGEVMFNGKAITREYRDSSGRTRRESTSTANDLVTITDPVAGYTYTLDPAAHTAHRQKINVQSKAAIDVAFPPQRPSTPTKLPNGVTGVSEYLGQKTIDGIAAYGVRTTLTYPPGSLSGNDKTITNTNEAWISPQLGVTVQLITDGASRPTSGSVLANVKYSEPDPSLFVVPAEYKIVGD